MVNSNQQFEEETKEQEVRVKERVRTIYVNTHEEAYALDPDELVVGVVSELELFRRTSGDKTPARSAWLDGK
jgi:hypothetical protein